MISLFSTQSSTASKLVSCLTLGVLGAVSMNGPLYLWPALLLSLSGFWIAFIGIAKDKPWKSFLAGFLFGFGFFVASLWWIGNALLVGGNPYAWAYPLAVCGPPALLALFPMVTTGLARLIAPKNDLKSFVVFAASLMLADYARGHMFTGFPWNLAAAAWTGTLPMLQILSVGGIYLLSFLTIFMFLVPAFVWKGDASRPVKSILLIATLAMATGLYVYGANRLTSHPTRYDEKTVVQIIQPSIAQQDKWNGDKVWDNYRQLVDLVKESNNGPAARIKPTTRFVVMPETALTYYELQTPQARDALIGHLRGYTEPNTYLLTGALLRDDAGYHNALLALDKQGHRLGSFDKFHLVPFGEYMPFKDYIPFGPIVQFEGFVEGPGPRTISLPDAPSFSPLVCYEVIFPGEVTAKTDPRPSWMVNVTNDAWYGLSPGPIQHLAQAQYRAIEEGIPIVRSANTGISAIFDSYGRPIVLTGLFSPSNEEHLLPLPAETPTIYSQISGRF